MPLGVAQPPRPIGIGTGFASGSPAVIVSNLPHLFDGSNFIPYDAQPRAAFLAPAALGASGTATILSGVGGTQLLIISCSIGSIDAGPFSLVVGSTRLLMTGPTGGSLVIPGGYLGADGAAAQILNHGAGAATLVGGQILYYEIT